MSSSFVSSYVQACAEGDVEVMESLLPQVREAFDLDVEEDVAEIDQAHCELVNSGNVELFEILLREELVWDNIFYSATSDDIVECLKLFVAAKGKAYFEEQHTGGLTEFLNEVISELQPHERPQLDAYIANLLDPETPSQ